jgi:hypothetical protein
MATGFSKAACKLKINAHYPSGFRKAGCNLHIAFENLLVVPQQL